MRQVLEVALLQFRLTVKSKGLMIAMVVLPLFMATIFGTLAAGASEGGDTKAYPVAVVQHDDSFAANSLIDLLRQDRSIAVQVIGADEATKALADKTAFTVLVIPAGFGQSLDAGRAPELLLQSLPGSNTELIVGPAIRRLVARFGGDYRLALKAAGGDQAKVADLYRQIAADRAQSGAAVAWQDAVRPEAAVDKSVQVGQVTMGFVVMFVMILVFLSGGVILQERAQSTWGRLLITPAGRLTLMGGYLISFLLIGLFQFGLLVLVTTALFHFSWGPLLPLLAMATLFILSTAGLGLFLAGLVRTPEQHRTIGTLILTVTSMLGGVFWPLEMMPRFMQKVAYLTPQAWAMMGFREVMLRGGAWSQLFWPLVVLAALTVIFMGAGLFRVRYE